MADSKNDWETLAGETSTANGKQAKKAKEESAKNFEKYVKEKEKAMEKARKEAMSNPGTLAENLVVDRELRQLAVKLGRDMPNIKAGTPIVEKLQLRDIWMEELQKRTGATGLKYLLINSSLIVEKISENAKFPVVGELKLSGPACSLSRMIATRQDEELDSILEELSQQYFSGMGFLGNPIMRFLMHMSGLIISVHGSNNNPDAMKKLREAFMEGQMGNVQQPLSPDTNRVSSPLDKYR